MKINIRGKNIKVTEAMESIIADKLSVLGKYFIIGDDATAKIVVRTYPNGQKIEVTIPTTQVILRAEEVDHDLYVAVDKIVDKLERQIRKQKTRLERKVKGKKHAFKSESLPIEAFEVEEDEVLVKTKVLNPKPMDLDEAILQMEMLGHSFYVYRDIESESINIVYKRVNGGYGLIETE